VKRKFACWVGVRPDGRPVWDTIERDAKTSAELVDMLWKDVGLVVTAAVLTVSAKAKQADGHSKDRRQTAGTQS
jgi:hypothetical protein